jgi:hypothetical protein
MTESKSSSGGIWGNRKDSDRYDLCLAWNWEYDTDFVGILEAACHSRGLSLLQITTENVAEVTNNLVSGEIACGAFWDRASEDDAQFLPLVQWAANHCAYCINPYERARRTWDKAAMHQTIADIGLHTPYTVVLPSYEEYPEVPSIDLQAFGEAFTIKPAHGGGGEGVIIKAASLSEVQDARQAYRGDRYLLQAYVTPVQLGSRAAWFRVIYCAGTVYLCWWDTDTYVYAPVTEAEEASHRLNPIRDITAAIARRCGLDLFSTEIALTPDDRFFVVDYVNDQIDLRLQSKAADGVPDDIVQGIADGLTGLVAAHCKK